MAKKEWLRSPLKTVISKIKEHREFNKIPIYERTIEQHQRKLKSIDIWKKTWLVNYLFLAATLSGNYLMGGQIAINIITILGMILLFLAILDCYIEKQDIGLAILQNKQLEILIENNIKIKEIKKDEN